MVLETECVIVYLTVRNSFCMPIDVLSIGTVESVKGVAETNRQGEGVQA